MNSYENPDYLALLAGINASPDDVARYGIIADWLEENGEVERAEFIRLQCGGSQSLTYDDAISETNRAAQLLRQFGPHWMGATMNVSGIGHHSVWRYGYISEVRATLLEILDFGRGLVPRFPVESWHLINKRPLIGHGGSWGWAIMPEEMIRDEPADSHDAMYWIPECFVAHMPERDRFVNEYHLDYSTEQLARNALTTGFRQWLISTD